jgi:hypothetical protein
VRYVFPLFLLLFAATALAVQRWAPTPAARIAAGGVLLATSLLTGFESGLLVRVATLSMPALILAALGAGAVALQTRTLRLDAQRLGLLAGVAVLAAALWGYVFWQSYVREYYLKGTGEPEGIPLAWALQYPREAPLWAFVRDRVPEDATLAVANTYFNYPFYDADFRRRLAYAPVRRGVRDFLHFPRLGETVPGDVIVQRMTAAMNADPDRATWLENLASTGAAYLVIGHLDHEPDPPERRFVAEDPARFQKLFEGPGGAVYKVVGAAESR